MRVTLRTTLVRHEGIRLKPYKDSVGKLTIGVGRNLDDVGISRQEALLMLANDITKVRREVKQAFPWFASLNSARKNVVLNMVFNLGLPRFRRFKKAIRAMKTKRWNDAAEEMLDSRWARQVKGRAKELARIMRKGA
jgi:lysozyme